MGEIEVVRRRFATLGEKVLYFATDSVIYVSPNSQLLIPIDTIGEMGLWTDENKNPNDPFVEFVSSGPKSYSIRSRGPGGKPSRARASI